MPTGPIARLAAYDRRRRSNLIGILRAWLDAFGDIGAAAAVHVHPHIFRYRLHRLAEIGGIDLDSPEAGARVSGAPGDPVLRAVPLQSPAARARASSAVEV